MSLVTYTAVIAVRYPELDNVQNDLVCFGNYVLGEQATSGGFLPIFWDASSAYMHAATDIGSAVDWLQRQVTLSSDENGCLAVSPVFQVPPFFGKPPLSPLFFTDLQ